MRFRIASRQFFKWLDEADHSVGADESTPEQVPLPEQAAPVAQVPPAAVPAARSHEQVRRYRSYLSITKLAASLRRLIIRSYCFGQS